MPIKDIYKKLIDPSYNPTKEELDEITASAPDLSGGLVLKGPKAVRNAKIIADKMLDVLTTPKIIEGKSDTVKLAEAYIRAKYPKLSYFINELKELPIEKMSNPRFIGEYWTGKGDINLATYPRETVSGYTGYLGHELRHLSDDLRKSWEQYVKMKSSGKLERVAETAGSKAYKSFLNFADILKTPYPTVQELFQRLIK